MQVCMRECVMRKEGGTEGAVLRDEKLLYLTGLFLVDRFEVFGFICVLLWHGCGVNGYLVNALGTYIVIFKKSYSVVYLLIILFFL